jgi:prolyl-tRNA synthetase
MRQSQLFTKTRKEAPADEVSKNAQLLIRGGFVHKEMAGVYTLLPLGVRVMEKIVAIIREEMNAIGGVQMKTSILQTKETWEKTNRWDDTVVDNWFKTTLKNGGELGLSFTNEEAYSNLMKDFISSYRDLPQYPYDFKTIFRNEMRSKSGMLRGREFYWKALYSFSKDQIEHDMFYENAKIAYGKIFKRVGIDKITYLTFASGSTFAKYSHEFQTISDAGEDIIYIDQEKNIAINQEVLTDDVLIELGIDREKLVEAKSIESGNIFSLGFKFSEPFGLTYKNEKGESIPVFMGSYGIGITRLIGTIAETFSDDRGIIWPESVAPFRVHLLRLGNSDQVIENADKLYVELSNAGIEVLYDDRDAGNGEKFAGADLIGIPYRIVVSEKSLTAGGVEIKKRNETEGNIVSINEVFTTFN